MGGRADIKKRAHVWCRNDVICEGMPEASFTISFNCLTDLVSIIIIILSKALERGLEKFLQKLL